MDWNLATLLKPPDKIPKNWDSNKSYLERQYKLLLEDFVQPLREALTELQNNPTSLNISNLKFLGSFKISQQVSHKFLGYQLISIGNSCDELPLPGSLLVLVPESCRSRVQDLGYVLAKAELDVLKEGQKAEFRISILSEDIENSLVYKVYEYSVYLEAYIHHLKVLTNSENVPLSKYIVDADTQIEQPEYLKKTKFPITFNSLKKNRSYNAQTTPLTVNEVYTLLMKKKDDKADTKIDNEKCEEINFEDFDDYELLDDSQKKSIKCCLTQEISLVQGPPGTGKSLIGTTLVQLLLENKHVWCEKSNYPILVICYTNSALDQFLEGLLPYTQKIVRLGGRSRSTVLESHTVSNIRQYMKDSQLRNQNLYTQERELYAKMSQLTLNAQESQENIKDLMKRYSEELESLSVQETKSLCRRADILGVTSTGAAKYFNIIHDLQPRIVLVEEAGEILESHMQACIPASTQQLILIGDHMQLRPQVASYTLAREEKHDISLFERLINSGLPYSQLNTQHRMVPEISKLLLLIYPDLKNHLAVTKRTKVPGISKSLFFLDHSFEEDQTMSGSKVNTQEGELAKNLANYFVEQGVEPSSITILTAYSGQLRLLKSLDVHPGVVLETVDNYQGYENRIVILSLVRGGSSSIGFLASPNRVCVALSRAKDCLIILGNIKLLTNYSQFWIKIQKILEAENNIGDRLPLKCEVHGNTTFVASSRDFDKLQDGGCGAEMCNHILLCGHKCAKQCHGLRTRHSCMQPCPRKCPTAGHPCLKLCGEPCGNCTFSVEIELPLCGHVKTKPCHSSVLEKDMKCEEICTDILECRHECSQPCHGSSTSHPPCSAPCPRTCPARGHLCPGKCGTVCPPCMVTLERMLACGHTATLSCSQDIDEVECIKKCDKMLECGHPCKSLCYENCDSECRFYGNIQLSCGHSVTGKCTPSLSCCASCPEKLACGHPCPARCGQPCATQCQVMVSASSAENKSLGALSCPHTPKIPCFLLNNTAQDLNLERSYKCTEKCSAVLLCGHKCCGDCHKCTEQGLHPSCPAACTRRLLCGHRCTAKCGQSCPPCQDKSFFRCPHTKIGAKCGEPPKICKEKCTWRCPHLKCSKKCGTACSRSICPEKCGLKLECGHKCVGICGELCICTECVKEDIKSTQEVYVNLGCGCPNINEDIKKHNSTPDVRLFECPLCRQPVQFSNIYKQEILKKIANINSLSDYFFMKSTKVKPRTELLIKEIHQNMSEIKNEEAKKCLDIMSKKLGSGKLMSSLELNSMEVKFELFKYLYSSNLENLGTAILGLQRINNTQIKQVLQSNPEIGKILTKSPELLSFEDGLWLQCQTCDKFYQALGSENLQPPCCINSQ